MGNYTSGLAQLPTLVMRWTQPLGLLDRLLTNQRANDLYIAGLRENGFSLGAPRRQWLGWLDPDSPGYELLQE